MGWWKEKGYGIIWGVGSPTGTSVVGRVNRRNYDGRQAGTEHHAHGPRRSVFLLSQDDMKAALIAWRGVPTPPAEIESPTLGVGTIHPPLPSTKVLNMAEPAVGPGLRRGGAIVEFQNASAVNSTHQR